MREAAIDRKIISPGRAMVLALALGSMATWSSRVHAEDPIDANIAGTTSLKDNAGRIEARMLSGLAVKRAASAIVDDIGTDFTSLTMIVLPLPAEPGSEGDYIGGAGWDVVPNAQSLPVVADMVRLRDALESYSGRSAQVASALAAECPRTHGTGRSLIESLNSATAVMHAAAPLINLFKQDFTYSNIGVNVREGMLVTAVRGELVKRRKAAPQASPTVGAASFGQAIDALGQDIASLPAPRCAETASASEAQRDRLRSDFASFSASLSGSGSVAGQTLLQAAEDQLQRYGPRPAMLVLAIDASGASLVERKNLTTIFGAEAATVSSGLMVSYEFYEPQSTGMGSLKAAGVLSCMSGAVGIRNLHKGRRTETGAVCF